MNNPSSIGAWFACAMLQSRRRDAVWATAGESPTRAIRFLGLVLGCLLVSPAAVFGFAVNDRVRSTDNGVKIRSTAIYDVNNGNVIGSVNAGAQGTIVAGPSSNGGFIWWRVDWDSGSYPTGWSAGDYLQQIVVANQTPGFALANQYRADTGAAIPLNGGVVPAGVGVLFKANVSDPDGDAVKYEVELRQLPGSFTGVPTHSSGFMASGSQATTTTATGLAAGNYGWKFRVVDSRGAANAWSSVGNPDFVVQAAPVPPPAPTAQSPGSGSAPGSTVATLTPTLAWSAVAGATYDVALSQEPYGAANIRFQQSGITANTIVVPAGRLVAGARYRWDVAATVGGLTSARSGDLFFQTSLPALPTVALTVPNGGETWTAGSTHTIAWSGTGSTANMAYYKIALSTDGGATWPAAGTANDLTPTGVYDPGARSFSWTIGVSLNTTQARVRVRALSADATILAEDVSSTNFTIAPVPAGNLPAPMPSTPLHGSTGQSTTPTLGWSAVANATSYRVMVATNAADLPTDPAADTGGASVIFNQAPATNSLTLANPLNAGTTYYWKVKARNATQLGTWSSTVSFTTQPAAPSPDTIKPTVSLTAPADGTAYTTPQTVLLTSTASDNVGVTKVEFYDGATLMAVNPMAPYAHGWAITSAHNGTHRWTARAYDAAGNFADSAVVTLTVNIPGPDNAGPTLAIASPPHESTVATPSVVVSGTASDSGSGNSGISSVTVAGTRAMGDTASGSDTASWSRTVNLMPGPNSITVVAKDGSPNQNETSQTIRVNYAPALKPTYLTAYDATGATGQTVALRAMIEIDNILGWRDSIGGLPVEIWVDGAKVGTATSTSFLTNVNFSYLIPANLEKPLLSWYAKFAGSPTYAPGQSAVKAVTITPVANRAPVKPSAWSITASSGTITATGARISWPAFTDPDGDAVSYVVRWGKNNTLGWLGDATTAATSFDLTGLTAGTPYVVEVMARDGKSGGDSAWFRNASDPTITTSGQPVQNPILVVTPTTASVSAAADSVSFSVSNSGGGAMSYTTGNPSASWLRITSGGTGGNGGAIRVAYDANNTGVMRSATFQVAANEAAGSPLTVTVFQTRKVSDSVMLPGSMEYIRQINNSDMHPKFNSANACGPCSAVIILTYFNLLSARPMIGQSGQNNNFSWYVAPIESGMPSSVGYSYHGYTFNVGTRDVAGGTVNYGAFGYLTQDFPSDPQTRADRAVQYLWKHGLFATFANAATEADVRAEIDAGRPVLLSAQFSTGGHIMVIRGYNPTQLIASDPWVRSDGLSRDQHAYTWSEIHHGGAAKWVVKSITPVVASVRVRAATAFNSRQQPSVYSDPAGDQRTAGQLGTVVLDATKSAAFWNADGYTWVKVCWDGDQAVGWSAIGSGESLWIEPVESSLPPSLLVPTVMTGSISNVASTSASVSGSVTTEAGGTVTQRGVVYSSSNRTPTISDAQAIGSGAGIGSFSVALSGLNIGTTYYARAFAVSSVGTTYGDTLSFATTIASNYAGTYFGTLGSEGGAFAVHVRADNTGSFLGYARGANVPLLSRSLTVDQTGRFSFTTAAGVSAAAANGSPGRAANAAQYVVDGVIGANGTLTGTVSGLNLSLHATPSAATGATQALAGFYQASAPNTVATTYSILSAAGQAYVLIVTPQSADGGTGTVDANGRLTVSTAGNAQIVATVQPQSAKLTVSVANSGAPATTYVGGSDRRVATERLINISSRAITSATNAEAMTAGFVIAGDSPKQVLVRGIGPALGQFGVSNALAAAKLELMRGQELLVSNTGWSTAPNASEVSAVSARLGAFPLPAGGRDTALLITLPPGAYTTRLSGMGGAGGVSLIEVYDATEGTVASEHAMINISTRARVGIGQDVLIAGLFISGEVPKRLLVRGVGPALAGFGVAGALADPQLKILQGNTVVAANDNWSSDPSASLTAQTASAVGAFPLDSGSRDAGVVLNLMPGAYTVQVSGVNNSAGIALVEIYEVP